MYIIYPIAWKMYRLNHFREERVCSVVSVPHCRPVSVLPMQDGVQGIKKSALGWMHLASGYLGLGTGLIHKIESFETLQAPTVSGNTITQSQLVHCFNSETKGLEGVEGGEAFLPVTLYTAAKGTNGLYGFLDTFP